MPGRIPDPRSKDAAMREALRGEGASKATHAATTRAEVAKEDGRTDAYGDWSVDDLRHRAAELHIEGRSTMRKDELIAALRHH